ISDRWRCCGDRNQATSSSDPLTAMGASAAATKNSWRNERRYAMLKMTVRRAREGEPLAVPQETYALACLNAADLGDGNARRLGGLAEGSALLRRYRHHN